MRKCRVILYLFVLALNVTSPLPVRQKQMIRPRPTLDIEVFPQFDCPFCPDNRQAPIAPGRQSIRRKPINPAIPRGRSPTQHDLTKILEIAAPRIIINPNRTSNNPCLIIATENKKLVDLMRRFDIA